MRKSTLLLLNIVMVLSFVACGGKKKDKPDNFGGMNPLNQQMFMQAKGKLDSIGNGKCDRYGQVLVALQMCRTPQDVARVMPLLQSMRADSCDDDVKNAIWILSRVQVGGGIDPRTGMQMPVEMFLNTQAGQVWLRDYIAGSGAGRLAQMGVNVQMMFSQHPEALMQYAQGMINRVGQGNPQFLTQAPAFLNQRY